MARGRGPGTAGLTGKVATMAEFQLIDRIRARAATRDDVLLGIGDDAALLCVPEGRVLAVATDTLNLGVHFPDDTAPADIGWKALAVNLSDLAAMGAQPAWCTLSLSLPEADVAWLDAFLDGFLGLAAQHRVALVGGDTTRGPLSVCVTAHGLLEPGRALRRDGARTGDEVWVTGTLGDAAGALALLRQAAEVVAPVCEAAPLLPVASSAARHALPALRSRLDRPEPRVGSGLALAGLAHCAIDVSDGLLADLGHVARASAVAVEVDVAALPCSDALAAAFPDDGHRWALQATGGDDYELCFTAAPESHHAVRAALLASGVVGTVIGRCAEGAGVRACRADGSTWSPPRTGHEHFAGADGTVG
jgi:thiamine-monophosphate kinase